MKQSNNPKNFIIPPRSRTTPSYIQIKKSNLPKLIPISTNREAKPKFNPTDQSRPVLRNDFDARDIRYRESNSNSSIDGPEADETVSGIEINQSDRGMPSSRESFLDLIVALSGLQQEHPIPYNENRSRTKKKDPKI